MYTSIKTKGSILLTLILLFSTFAYATDGYFSHGYGIRHKALGGSGISIYYSTIGAANNPASLVFLGKRFDAEVSFFIPVREFTVTGNPSGFPGTFGLAPGTVQSESEFFVVPAIGSNFMIGENNSIGISIYGNGGMNTDYPAAVFGGDNPTGVNLSQLFLNASYSRKLGEKHSIGASAIFAYQWFEVTGLENFAPFSSDATNLTGNGSSNSTGFGFKVGYMGELAPGLRFGAAYQSKMFMSEFDEYAGLFAEKGGFDIPSSWKAGFSYSFADAWMLAIDVQQIMYSEVNSIGNPVDPMALPPAFPDGQGGFIPNPDHVPLGADEGSGFGWEDMTVIKFGTEFSGIDTWKLRAGFSTGNQPIPESEMIFNILAPGVIENHVTFGFSKAFNEKNELSFALMHGFSNAISGPNAFEAPNQQEIELKMHQWEFSLGFSF